MLYASGGLLLFAAMFFQAWRTRGTKRSATFASFGCWPFGVFSAFIWVGVWASESTITEALLPFMFMAFVAGSFLAIALGKVVAGLMTSSLDIFSLAGGLLTGAAMGVVHFTIRSPQAGMDLTMGWLLGVVVVDAIWAALATSWIQARGVASGKSFYPGLLITCLASATAAGWALPSALFRAHDNLDPLTGMELTGARRYANGYGPVSDKARSFLAMQGDEARIDQLLQEVSSGKATGGVQGNIAILMHSRSHDPRFAAALKSGLRVLINSWTDDNTYSEEDRAVEAISGALGEIRDGSATSLLIEVYKLRPTFINIPQAAAKALAQIGTPDAAAFAVEQLKDRKLPQEIAKEFSSMNNRAVRAAWEERVDYFKGVSHDRQAASAPLSSLQIEDLRKSALTGTDAGRRMEATLALMRKHDAKRIRAVIANAQMLANYGNAKQFEGLKDPELARGLIDNIRSAGAKPDVHVATVLARWAPPESLKVLGKLAFSLNLTAAIDGLGKIGGERAAQLLIQRSRSVSETEGSLQLYVIRALSRTGTNAAEAALSGFASKNDTRPVLNWNGNDLYISDAAAFALQKMRKPVPPTYKPKGTSSAIAEWFEKA